MCITFLLHSFCGVYGSSGGKRYDVRSSLQQFKDVMAEGNVMSCDVITISWLCGRLYVCMSVCTYVCLFLCLYIVYFVSKSQSISEILHK